MTWENVHNGQNRELYRTSRIQYHTHDNNYMGMFVDLCVSSCIF